MSEKITINIDGKEVITQEGEFILTAARANDIYIPAICYLTRCSPTLACRICLVEADGKQVYACNAKAKDGMNITTSTETIVTERRAIMEVYDVNHPLQCGVCDQSGECELQNYTLEMGVDSQSYAIKDVDRSSKDWGHLHYDASLCIVCERCTTVCKDMIGDNSLKTVARGGDPLDAEYKESMPKDAYSMWNKLNKSIIGLTSGEEMLDCTSCGECASVCPVGALVDTQFMYKSNAWELKQIPATCGHCSAGCQITYDVKHTDIANPEDKIYRVTNEWNYVSLCGAGRYGFDYENRVDAKDEVAFTNAIEAFTKADTIEFTSTITNEEAYLLQKLKEKNGYKLVNSEAKAFQAFLREYSQVSGTTLYGSDLKAVHNSNFVISVGAALKSDNPNARYALNNSVTVNKGAGIYFHPVSDPVVEGMGKSIMSVTHAPLQEEAVMYLILDLFADKSKLPSSLVEYLASFHSLKTVVVEETVKEKTVEIVQVTKLNEETGVEEIFEEEKSVMVTKKIQKDVEVDENRLLAMVGASDKFTEELEKNLNKKDTFALIVGPDFYTHPNAKNLARLVALVEKYSALNVTMIPSLTNSLGVALICELDDARGSYTIGYNVEADFTLSALGAEIKKDLDMPAINQQEGTLTSVNKRVNPTNAALAYKGYELNDIANALGIKSDNIIDYTVSLPAASGFKAQEFDSLPNHYENDGSEVRGYVLENVAVNQSGDESVEALSEMKLDGTLIYLANPVRQFSAFTNKATNLNEVSGLYMSPELLSKSELSEGESVKVKNEFGEIVVTIISDNKIAGDIAILPTFDSKLNSEALFSSYRFATASIERV
ncbi:MAG: NADH-quinone oxidoreductase subunit G [Epsilonproteobacteria bacterium]|nr:NADH-quinone oxidoreductase subunit G [Campylobacterota bacterium]OIO15004.1 MAG: ferredoxin [Helicobacteraceae bacterium CG1_02_36_14]PIP10539.1 MAG: ferredoxin [Sulfurimonas sp. CG23_combo_of_CG06-09_8_20_14_all_36_33]PIS26989.1 MAG: ferredoxin [Sulfurimonas sp. CG08_land_8_20_14_0_20_36_33]PIU35883.1 MAG: ferredoxin [Sulfurimonas sp. CG07_land_8_20_14_0_80_36_56]PIV03460.1 MAG: ferredoxin [Sulfurimonas sp. CG03_land_8_20_14_0_80_36_25]PIV35406.1 MAG: ferredoxin [Sulfurimonas sp. CG02_la